MVRRTQLEPRWCAADGCKNRRKFTPIRDNNIYCSNTCSSYMRWKRKRDKDRAEAQEGKFSQADLRLQQFERIERWRAARRERDFKKADEIRAELVEAGIDIQELLEHWNGPVKGEVSK